MQRVRGGGMGGLSVSHGARPGVPEPTAMARQSAAKGPRGALTACALSRSPIPAPRPAFHHTSPPSPRRPAWPLSRSQTLRRQQKNSTDRKKNSTEPHSSSGPPVAVVGRGPDRDQLVVEHPLEPLHHQLVRARNQLHLRGARSARSVGRTWRRAQPERLRLAGWAGPCTGALARSGALPARD